MSPFFAWAQRLDAAKLAIAKRKFTAMERLGIVRCSDSAWDLLLHMVPNADRSWRPCGDLGLRDMPFLVVYLDDILVASASPEEHLSHLRLIINPAKCQFRVSGN